MLGVQKWMGERGKWSLGPLIDDIDDGVVAPALRCAHLTPEGHLEDVGNVGTGHHQLHWGGMGTGESGTELYTTALGLMSCVCQRMKFPGCS